MDVYVVVHTVDYEGSDIIGIYSSLEKAKNIKNITDWDETIVDGDWKLNKYNTWYMETPFGRITINDWTVE